MYETENSACTRSQMKNRLEQSYAMHAARAIEGNTRIYIITNENDYNNNISCCERAARRALAAMCSSLEGNHILCHDFFTLRCNGRFNKAKCSLHSSGAACDAHTQCAIVWKFNSIKSKNRAPCLKSKVSVSMLTTETYFTRIEPLTAHTM